MAGYWLNSFFVYLRTETKSRSIIRSQKRTKILSSRVHTGHRNLVMELKQLIFEAWKVMEFNSQSLKVMENYSLF